MKRTIVVIGAGPAGLMASIQALKAGAKVHLFDKNEYVGKKMGITGKGRCNITSAKPVEELIQHTPGNGKFLYSAYSQFSNRDLMDYLDEEGLAYKVERGDRLFPKSDSAIEVRNFFRDQFLALGGQLHLEEEVTEITVQDGAISQVITAKGTYSPSAVIMATGGISYPVTGSTGDGQRMLGDLGIKSTPLLGALVPLEIKDFPGRELMGISLKNVEVSLWIKDKKKGSYFGEMLCTHFGFSGPIILTLSREVSKALHYGKQPVVLSLDVKPALTEEQLDRRIQRDFEEGKNKMISTLCRSLLPQKLIDLVLERAHIEKTKKVHQITKEERITLGKTLKHMTFQVIRTRPVGEAIVTCGGISTKEIDPKTMAVKAIKGLYVAGELIDIDAETGGFNLQAAFSTGYVAGRHAAQEE